MSGLHIMLVRPDDETLRVEVNGQEVATATHENVGWSGVDLVEKLIRGLAEIAGATVTESNEPAVCLCEGYGCKGECCGIGACSCTPRFMDAVEMAAAIEDGAGGE